MDTTHMIPVFYQDGGPAHSESQPGEALFEIMGGPFDGTCGTADELVQVAGEITTDYEWCSILETGQRRPLLDMIEKGCDT